ncbi:MAG: hypothetical protein LBS01_07750 [Prevotellaceae bacterium]|nr:hypothetical protein [Prevotellaceae bacterium]
MEKILRERGNRVPFSVPEGYFEQFTASVLQLTVQQSSQKPRLFGARHWWSMAAAVTLLLSVSFYSYRDHHRQQLAENREYEDTYLMSQIDNSDLVEYYLTSYAE